MTFNTLRDRLLLRLLSQPTRDAMFRVVFQDLDSEINHFICSDDPEHIAPALTHLADLMEEKPQWTAQLNDAFALAPL
jgi:hypothetical protein